MKFFNYLVVVFMLLVLTACAPMPGPSIPREGISKMSIEELLQHSDKYRGNPEMMHDYYKEIACNSPMSSYDAYKQGYLKIHILPQWEVTAKCFVEIAPHRPIFAAFMVGTGSPPMACITHRGTWKDDDTCYAMADIYASQWDGNMFLLHEIRHANGYVDKLY